MHEKNRDFKNSKVQKGKIDFVCGHVRVVTSKKGFMLFAITLYVLYVRILCVGGKNFAKNDVINNFIKHNPNYSSGGYQISKIFEIGS